MEAQVAQEQRVLLLVMETPEHSRVVRVVEQRKAQEQVTTTVEQEQKVKFVSG